MPPPARRTPRSRSSRLAIVGIAAVGAGVGTAVVVGVVAWLAAAAGWSPDDAVLPAAIAAGATVAAGAAVAILVAWWVRRDVLAIARAGRDLSREVAKLRREVAATHAEATSLRRELPAIAGLAPLGEGYPLPFGGAVPMAPDALALLARLFAERRPSLVVELGSGLSSLVLGLTARRLGAGRIVSVDHEARWADETRRRVEALGLDDRVTVVHAPLAVQRVRDEERTWYDLSGVQIPEGPVGFLVVDGPPASLDPAGFARWPAFHALQDRLGPEAVIFVDDMVRDGERRMVERWLAEVPGWQVTHVPTVRGTAILERIPAPPPA